MVRSTPSLPGRLRAIFNLRVVDVSIETVRRCELKSLCPLLNRPEGGRCWCVKFSSRNRKNEGRALKRPCTMPTMDGEHDPFAVLEFGRFTVVPHRRELPADGKPVTLGGRAFDTLLALIYAGGSVIDK